MKNLYRDSYVRTEQNRTEHDCHSLRSCQVVIIGCMDHTIDHTYESANRVYNVLGICPTIPCCQGGSIHPKILVVVR